MYIQKASEVIDGVIVVDWSKGPDDAQYYSPETDDNFEGWMKIQDGTVHVCLITWDDWKIEAVCREDELENDEAYIKKEIK